MNTTKFTFAGLLLCATLLRLDAADTKAPFVYHADTKLIDADFENRSLSVVMRDLQTATGVEIEMPSALDRQVSAKFSGLKIGDAMGRLLPGLSYYGSIQNGAYHVRVIDPNATGTGSTSVAKTAPTTRSFSYSPGGVPRPPGSQTSTGPVIVGGKKGGNDPANLSGADRKALEELMRASGRDRGFKGGFPSSGNNGSRSSSSSRKDRPR